MCMLHVDRGDGSFQSAVICITAISDGGIGDISELKEIADEINMAAETSAGAEQGYFEPNFEEELGTPDENLPQSDDFMDIAEHGIIEFAGNKMH